MVQVLPYVQTPLERLLPHINEAAQMIGQNFQKRSDLKKMEANAAILNDPNATPTQKAHALSQMPDNYKKSTAPLWAAVIGPEAEAAANKNQLEQYGINFNDQGKSISPSKVKNDEQKKAPITQNQIKDLSDEDLVAMSAVGGASEKLATGEIKRRELQTKKDEALWNYKPTQDFLNQIEERARDAMTAIDVADEFIKLAESGEISPSNLRNLAAAKYGDTFPFLHSAATAQAKLLEKLEASGLKEIFPKPTEREFFFINSAQAQLGKTDAANISVAQLQKRFAEIPIRAAEFAQDVIKENGGTPPRDLTSKVRKKMEAYKKDLLTESAAITFEYGDKGERKKAAEYLDNKGKNLPLTEEKKKEIFKLAGNDPKEALKLAIELGYHISEE